MKNVSAHYMSRYLLFFLLLTGTIATSSCARKIRFDSSRVVPAAEGTVKLKKDKNDNYSLSISVRNLAESKKLEPPRNTYVVWIETSGNGTKNIGQMNSGSGLFSSKLKASLNTITPYKPTRVFITAEDDATIQYPGFTEVLRTRSF